MKPAARPGGASRTWQRGVAAVELAVILSATIVLMPAVVLFAKVFYQYSVMKEATRDAAAYMASLPRASVKDNAERARAMTVARQMVFEAAANSSMLGSNVVQEAVVECDDHTCAGLVPDNFDVKVTFTLNADVFTSLIGEWIDHEERLWEITARSTIPYSK